MCYLSLLDSGVRGDKDLAVDGCSYWLAQLVDCIGTAATCLIVGKAQVSISNGRAVCRYTRERS